MVCIKEEKLTKKYHSFGSSVTELDTKERAKMPREFLLSKEMEYNRWA